MKRKRGGPIQPTSPNTPLKRVTENTVAKPMALTERVKGASESKASTAKRL